MAYTDAQIQIQEIPIGGGQVQVVGMNPRTGKLEPVLRSYGATDEYGNTATSYYFKGDADVPANAQEAFGVPHVPDSDMGWFDKALEPMVQGGLAAMAGAGAYSALGGGAGAGSGFVGDIPTVADVGGTSVFADAAGAGAVGDVVPGMGADGVIDVAGDAVGSTVVDSGLGGSALGTDLAGETLASQVADALGVSEGALSGIAKGLGIALPTFLGMFGANELGNSLHDISQQSHDDWATLRGDRLPFLDQSQYWLAHPGQYMKGPGKQAINSTLRGLSVTGNPFGDPFKMEMAADAGLRSWKDMVLGLGNIGTGTPMAPTPTASIAGAQADASGYNALGWGIGQALNPQPTIADLLKIGVT